MPSEANYLAHYDASPFPCPLVTVDSVLFTVHEAKLCVLLVKRARHPYKGHWGLPGGFIDMQQDNSTQETALRKITEKTGMNPPWLEQLKIFSGPQRDPRGWSLTHTWFALIAWSDCQPHISTVSDVRWIPVAQLPQYTIAFDHQTIINLALQRLREKTLYSMLPVYCLPAEFTLSQLQDVIEVILGHSVQRKSLIRRFEASAMFEETGKNQATGARKARIYRRKAGVDIYLFSRNLVVE